MLKTVNDKVVSSQSECLTSLGLLVFQHLRLMETHLHWFDN